MKQIQDRDLAVLDERRVRFGRLGARLANGGHTRLSDQPDPVHDEDHADLQQDHP